MEKEKVILPKKKGISIILIIFIIILVMMLGQPSEEKLCDDAIHEAEYELIFNEAKLSDWVKDKYDINFDYLTYHVSKRECDVLDRNNIDITLDLDISTSNDQDVTAKAIFRISDSGNSIDSINFHD